MNYCPDCGCKMYNGVCTNCHEEMYIAEQYYELGMPIPESFQDRLNDVEQEQKLYAIREDVKRENSQKY